MLSPFLRQGVPCGPPPDARPEQPDAPPPGAETPAHIKPRGFHDQPLNTRALRRGSLARAAARCARVGPPGTAGPTRAILRAAPWQRPAVQRGPRSREEGSGDESAALERSPSGRWQKPGCPRVNQSNMPGLQSTFLAMDTEEGVEVVWNELQFMDKAAFMGHKEIKAIFEQLVVVDHPNIVKVHKYWLDMKGSKAQVSCRRWAGSVSGAPERKSAPMGPQKRPVPVPSLLEPEALVISWLDHCNTFYMGLS
uniref:Nuclear receptor-binding protein 2 n=1 Tax=Laticauda laticaudata TaxID=8630 RepID=A0A8C5RLC3_LATLA